MNLVSLLSLFLFAQAGTQPAALEDKARAQALLKEGTQYYQQGAFDRALEKFEQAYAVFPSPKLFFNIGKANRELGRPLDAVNAFESFTARATEASPELLAEARRLSDELSRQLGKLLVDCTLAGAEISVDGNYVGRAPLVDTVRVMPGNHQVTATGPNATPDVKNVTVAAGTVETVVLQPRSLAEASAAAALPRPAPLHTPSSMPMRIAPTAPAPAASTIETQRSLAPAAVDEGWLLGRKWTWVAAGATVLFATTATIAGLSMQSKFDELNKSCGSASVPAGGTWTGCTASDFNSLDARKDTANIFWGLSAAAAITAGVLFYVEGRSVAIAPMAGAETGLLANVRY